MSSEKKELRLSETLFEFKRPSEEARKQQEQNESKKDDEISNVQKEIVEKDELLKDMKDKNRQIERLTNQNKAIAIANIKANKTKRNNHNIQTMDVDMVQCEYMDVDIKAFYHQNEILRLQKIVDEMKKDNVKQKVSAIEQKENERLKKELKAMTAKLEKSEIKIVSKEMEMRDIDALRKQIKKYEKQIAVLKKQKKKSVSSEKTVQIQIAAYEAEIERLQKENDERACMNERDDEEIEQLKRTNAIKDDLIYAYKETIRELKGENDGSHSNTASQDIRITTPKYGSQKIVSQKSISRSPLIVTRDGTLDERISLQDVKIDGLLLRLSEKNKEIEDRDGIIYILEKQAMEQEKEIKDRIEKETEQLIKTLNQKETVIQSLRKNDEKLRQSEVMLKKKDAQIAGLIKNYNILKQIDGHHVELHNVSDKMGQNKDYQHQINILMTKLKEKNEEIAERDSVIFLLEKHAKTLEDEMNIAIKDTKLRDFDEFEQGKIGKYEQEIRRLTKEIDVRDQLIEKENASMREDEKLLLENDDFIERIEKENERLFEKLDKNEAKMAKKDLKIKLLKKKNKKLVKDDEKHRMTRKKKIENLKKDIAYKERLMQGGWSLKSGQQRSNGKRHEIMFKGIKMQNLCPRCKAKVENNHDEKMNDLVARISSNHVF